MPFDNPYTPTSDAAKWWDSQQQLAAEAPKPDRWNSHLRDAPGITRTLLPLSDTTVLMAMRDILIATPHKWLRGNMGNCDAACAVGWLANFTEPTNRPQKWSSQTMRLLKRLYRALPKYAQKRGRMHHAIAAYNDRSSTATLYRWLTRAIKDA